MSEKILCVLAGYDAKTEKVLSGLQERLYANGFSGTQTRNLPQHITLGVFPSDPERERELKERVAETAGRHRPFDVTFNHVGIFGGSKVLFVALDTGASLLALKESFGTSFNWTPHTTMLIDEPQIVYRALPLVAAGFEAFQGCVEMLHLYEFWPSRHIASFALTGKAGANERHMR